VENARIVSDNACFGFDRAFSDRFHKLSV
jgi:hypothetical protein